MTHLPAPRDTGLASRSPAITGPQDEAPLSVWPTAQHDARTQRRGRYLPAATAHPGKMLPAIAATAITRYTQPGDLVADPMCGIGTTLIEAIHLGRDALGVEYEPRWAELAAAGITHARRHGATGTGQVVCGDARQLPNLAPAAARGQVALVVTSPPYGPSVHGHVRAGHGGVAKFNNRYSRDPVNLAHHGLDALLEGITHILTGCAALLRPGGIVVVTARPWRHRGELVDLPSAVIAAGRHAGLVPVERCVALLAGLGGEHLIPRPSFFQLDNVRKARARGRPWHLIVHEDVLVLRASRPRSRGRGRHAGGGMITGLPPQPRPRAAGGCGWVKLVHRLRRPRLGRHGGAGPPPPLTRSRPSSPEVAGLAACLRARLAAQTRTVAGG